jgi:hypothetical protein
MGDSVIIVSDEQAERFREIQSQNELNSTQLLRRMNNLWEGLTVLEREYAEVTGGLAQLDSTGIDAGETDD